MTQTLESVLSQHGIDILPDETAKQPQRGGKNNAHWLFLHRANVDGITIEYAYFGDWSSDLEGEWHGQIDHLTDDQRKKFYKAQKAAAKKNDALRKESWDRRKADAVHFLSHQCHDTGAPTEYLRRKGIPELLGATTCIEDGKTVLVVPLRDVHGEIWSYQRIFDDKIPLRGKLIDKLLLGGARKEGCFFTFGEINPSGTILVCEGFSTAASVFLGFGKQVATVAAIDAGNLLRVGRELHNRYPGARLVFCADNDKHRKGGEPGSDRHDQQYPNRGVAAASTARDAVGGEIRVAQCTGPGFSEKDSDFNDVMRVLGLAEVRRQIEDEKNVSVLGQITPIFSEKIPPEVQLAERVLEYLGRGSFLRQGKDLFHYVGTHWEMVTEDKKVELGNYLNEVARNRLNSGQVESAYRTLMNLSPVVREGHSLLVSDPNLANFKNGTLHVTRVGKGKFIHEWKEHNPLDYVTHCLPFDYQEEGEETCEEFEEMLKTVFSKDPEPDKCRDHYQEFLGACLMPRFPNISIFFGPPGTGKSTLLKLAIYLVGKKNRCSVDPTRFDGFKMANMPGKLVNIVTELSTEKPLSDAVVKLIIDRVEMEFDRKHKDSVMGSIPPLHGFACNKLPSTREGETKSFTRRMTLIKVDGFRAVGKDYDKEYDSWIWEQGAQAIVNFAVRGMLRLIENGGFYTRPKSSEQHMDAWMNERDPIGLFLTEVRGPGVTMTAHKVYADKSQKYERKKLSDAFRQWHVEEFESPCRIGRTSFYRRIESEGFSVLATNGVRYFEGLGQEMPANAPF